MTVMSSTDRSLLGTVVTSPSVPGRDGRGPLSPPTEREQPVAVRVHRTGQAPVEFVLDPSRSYLFGRAEDASWVFPDQAVSRIHARLDFAEGVWSFRDLESRNGSFMLLGGVATKEDPRADARRLRPNVDHLVRCDSVVLLANGDSQLEFLAAIPEGVRSTRVEATSDAARRLNELLDRAALHRLPLVLLGPSGCGKTYAARSIHERAGRGAFISVNCGRLPVDAAQLASELVGHVAGAFTGAARERRGRLWAADGGTLFLDEVESTPPMAQDFLLDLLEGSGDFAPLGVSGGDQRGRPDFRLISASKKQLAASGLRGDLCQRLAAGDVIALPTLADRRPDIPGLIDVFVVNAAKEQGRPVAVTPEAIEELVSRDWPGQVRELEATVRSVVTRACLDHRAFTSPGERLVIGVERFREYLRDRETVVGSPALGHRAPAPTGQFLALSAAEHREADGLTLPLPRRRPADLTKEEVQRVLVECGGNKTHAAERLGIAINTLKAKLK